MSKIVKNGITYTVIDGNLYTGEECYWRTGGNTGMLPDRITPSFVNVLKPNEVFVFGSNFKGKHIAGAAYAAKEKFGAVWGIGEGLQGQSYAIPTMEGKENVIPAIERFTSFARQHKELKFYVTAIGCGIAGYEVEDIAPYFLEAAYLPNVFLPVSFWKIVKNVVQSKSNMKNAVSSLLESVSFMHKNNLPTWNAHTDEVIFNSLERDQMWQLGILLKVISPSEKEPSCKVLPEGLRHKLLKAFQEV